MTITANSVVMFIGIVFIMLSAFGVKKWKRMEFFEFGVGLAFASQCISMVVR